MSDFQCKYLIGGTAYNKLHAKFDKANAYSVHDVVSTGTAGAAGAVKYAVGAAHGDFLVRQYAKISVPAAATVDSSLVLRWVKNLGHRAIERAVLKLGDAVLMELDSHYFDAQASHFLDAAHRDAYDHAIGNTPSLIDPTVVADAAGTSLPAAELIVPLPLPSDVQSAQHFPLCKLGDTQELVWEIKLHPVAQLLLQGNHLDYAILGVPPNSSRIAAAADISDVPQLSAEVVSLVAVVSDAERAYTKSRPVEIVWAVPVKLAADNVADAIGAEENIQFVLPVMEHIRDIVFGIHNSGPAGGWLTYGDLARTFGIEPAYTMVEPVNPVADFPIASMRVANDDATLVAEKSAKFLAHVHDMHIGKHTKASPGLFYYAFGTAAGSGYAGSLFSASAARVVVTPSEALVRAHAGEAFARFVDENGQASIRPAGYSNLRVDLPAFVAVPQQYVAVAYAHVYAVLRFNDEGVSLISNTATHLLAEAVVE